MHGWWPGQVSLLEKILVTKGMGEVWKQSQLGQPCVSGGLQRGELATWQSNQKCHEGLGAGRCCGNMVVLCCSPLEGWCCTKGLHSLHGTHQPASAMKLYKSVAYKATRAFIVFPVPDNLVFYCNSGLFIIVVVKPEWDTVSFDILIITFLTKEGIINLFWERWHVKHKNVLYWFSSLDSLLLGANHLCLAQYCFLWKTFWVSEDFVTS